MLTLLLALAVPAALQSGSLVQNARGEIALATGLSVATHERDAELSARSFLFDYGASFGVQASDALVLRKDLLAGEAGPVIFERTLRGLTVFGGHVTVGLDAERNVVSASSAGSLAQPAAEFRLDEAAARRVALARHPGQVAWIAQGWSLEGRPTWLAAVVQQDPYRSFRVAIDGETGAAGLSMPLLRSAQGKLYRISPSKPYATSTPPAACNLTTDSSGNKKVDTCAQAETVTLLGLKGDGTLSGNPAPHEGRTSVYNCNGGTTYDTAHCTQTFHADASGNFIPGNLTDYGTNKSDPMAELQAYYFVDTHSRFMDSLDPSFVGLPLIPGFPNAYMTGSATGLPTGSGSSPMDNAFFDPAAKIMVFGQGSSVDFAYDGEVVFHEMTHAACGAIGDTLGAHDVLFPVAAAHGLYVDPLAVNEGNADTFSFMEPGVNDPYLAEFDARDELSVLGQKIPIGPAGYIRDEGPDFLKTCQGDGNAQNPGRSGEAHDDGEVWAEFTYETFQGLKPIPLPDGVKYQSVATPAMFKALQQLVALPSEQQTFSVYAGLFEQQVRTRYGKSAGDYVRCVADRRALSACDGMAVTVYSGEKPFNDLYVKNAWKSFYYSKAEAYGTTAPPSGFDGVPASFQWKLHVPAGATGIRVNVCDITPEVKLLGAVISPGGTGNLHISYGKPVSYTTVGSGVTADWRYPAAGSWTVKYLDCGGGLAAARTTTATISGATCDNCASSSGDDHHAIAEGDWYFEVANTAGAASFASFQAEILGVTPPARPAVTHPACTLGPLDTPDGGSDAGPLDAGSADAGGGTPDAGHGGGGDAGTGVADGGEDCSADGGDCIRFVKGGCGSTGAGVATLLGLLAVALFRRRRRAS